MRLRSRLHFLDDSNLRNAPGNGIGILADMMAYKEEEHGYNRALVEGALEGGAAVEPGELTLEDALPVAEQERERRTSDRGRLPSILPLFRQFMRSGDNVAAPRAILRGCRHSYNSFTSVRGAYRAALYRHHLRAVRTVRYVNRYLTIPMPANVTAVITNPINSHFVYASVSAHLRMLSNASSDVSA